MWHTVFISVHAAAGLVAFVAGCVAIRRGQLFRTYLWSLAAMELFLVLAIAAEWTVIGGHVRLLFSALAALGLVMVGQGVLARRSRPSRSAGRSADYVARVGFTLVALLDAFVVVALLNAQAPTWTAVAAGFAIGAGGHFVLRRAGAQAGAPSVAAMSS